MTTFSSINNIVRTFGSSNGLIALCCEYPDDSLFVDIVLFNPSINSYVSLPHYDPPKSPITMRSGFSFEYDNLNDDYKIVKRTDYLPQNSVWLREVNVYNLRDNCWKTVHVESMNHMRLQSFYGYALIDNIIYYIFNAHLENNPLLRGFDLASYKWSDIALPDFEGHEMKCTDIAGLGVLDDCLCVVSSVLPEKEGAYVWVMKEYGVWSKLFDVNDAINVGALIGAPISCSNGGDELILKRRDEDGLHCYNIKRKVIKPVIVICNRCYIRDVFLCVESLIFTDNMIEVGNEDADNCDL
ncbi:F-box protein CPR1-like [Amaranthus tricolor]|uniref:F-box protein CPR1-like n=1 Tax=Amaranthus tricolor TaxID=29722 RepID=UPI0025870AE8|nr:F-box protein CPR1-like [Amaranthus tricolor]